MDDAEHSATLERVVAGHESFTIARLSPIVVAIADVVLGGTIADRC